MTLFALLLALQDPRVVEDVDFDRDYAKALRAYEAAAALEKKDPATALRMLDAQVLAALPPIVEARLAVRVTKGALRGTIREERDFFPWRLAGRCALAAGDPARAIACLEKSPGSAALLAEARKAAAPLQKPAARLEPFLEKGDFAGALEASRDVERVRAEAVRFQKARTARVADVLPRLREETFRAEHLDPCLKDCARMPAELETAELRWVRELAAWTRAPEAAGLDRLALAALAFEPDYHALLRLAQEERLKELDVLAEQARAAAREERAPILARFDAVERAYRALAAAKEIPELREVLPRIRGKLPVDVEALSRARGGASTVAGLRALARELEGLWVSGERGRLAPAERRDLALHLALSRAAVLLLEGRTVEEAAKDVLVADAVREAPAPPEEVSPKLRDVFRRAR